MGASSRSKHASWMPAAISAPNRETYRQTDIYIYIYIYIYIQWMIDRCSRQWIGAVENRYMVHVDR